MRLHRNAALSWSGRRRLAERVVVEGWTVSAAAAAAGISARCARKWVGRYRAEGLMFHMPGRWEFLFEVRGADGTERFGHSVRVE